MADVGRWKEEVPVAYKNWTYYTWKFGLCLSLAKGEVLSLFVYIYNVDSCWSTGEPGRSRSSASYGWCYMAL